MSLRAASGFRLIWLCFFLSGATGLVYQVVWLRMLGLVFGHTVYAITTVLTAFMAGLALGSFVFARLAPRLRNLVAAYGWLEIAIGLYCATIPVLLGGAARGYLGLHRSRDVVGAHGRLLSLCHRAVISSRPPAHSALARRMTAVKRSLARRMSSA